LVSSSQELVKRPPLEMFLVTLMMCRLVGHNLVHGQWKEKRNGDVTSSQ